MKPTLPTRIRSDLFAGILVMVPVGITLWMLFALVDLADGVIRALPPVLRPETHLGYPIPGLGVIVTLLMLFLVGLGMRYYAGQRVVETLEGWLARVPLANGIYQGIKQVVQTVAANKGAQFRQVVLVEYPRRDLYCLAFVTNLDSFMTVDGVDPAEVLVSIFLPTTPNPTSGFYLLVPQRDLRKVNISIEEAFKLIMSAGIVTPEGDRVANLWLDLEDGRLTPPEQGP